MQTVWIYPVLRLTSHHSKNHCRCRRKTRGMVQTLEHLNGKKINQQDSYGKETPKDNKIISGVDKMNRPCLFNFCPNSTNINDRKNCFVTTGTLTTASVWTWSSESHETLCFPAASSQEVAGGWEKEKEDALGQPSGETLDERTDQKQKEGPSHPLPHTTGEAGAAEGGCAEWTIQREERKINLGESLCVMEDKSNKHVVS